MNYKKMIASSFLVSVLTLATTIVFAANCDSLFTSLDKKLYEVSGKDRIKKLTDLENELFAAIDQCKTKSGMFVLMGEIQIDFGQLPLAVVYGRKAVELDNKYWRAHKLLGSALMLTNDAEQGLESLTTAASLAPDNINVKLNMVSALIYNKKYDKALIAINKVIGLNDTPTLATAYYLRSQAYKGVGLVIEADKDLKEAQSLGFKITQR